MNTLIFHNPGEIDIRGACIAGLSAKESKSPIGYFGTGLKYSIACILRWGGEITIFSGENEYKFEAQDLEFRGEQFKQIVMRVGTDVIPLGFTTEYGKNWKPWQVFRELYANARDENGTVELNTHRSAIGAGWTHVFVTCDKLINPFHNRDSIILPLSIRYEHESAKVQFSEAPAEGAYYRGVRVLERAACYTWNILEETKLTEDRTLLSDINWSHIFDHFIERDLHDVEILMRLFEFKYLNNEPKMTRIIEHKGEAVRKEERPLEATYMDWHCTPTHAYSWHSKEYKEAIKRLYLRNPSAFSKLRAFVKSIDEKLIEETLHVMTVREQLMFDKAKELVAMFGFEKEINTLSISVMDLGADVLGRYEHGSIYLSPRLFEQGTKQLVSTLYEECFHHRTEDKDCTYNMQNDLFNIIISLNEELHKVIC